ncbi:type II 3-dehydroquinate dehydratase [Tepidicaulis sp. LMO-SS28]|uniref:type II 3-dehydroquinate dehydratase n=1 Tax=Tepidicaulis sp. LMO-SS28 TaxID=3447455 RepID=UPI003EE35C9B
MATSAKTASAKTGPAKVGPIYVLNGPNLNLLGKREPHIYGTEGLAGIEKRVKERAKALGHKIEFRQTNSEGELITWIQEAGAKGAGLIINPAAYSHTSIGLHDAIAAIDVPVVEVHISNIHKREAFRHHSYVSSVALGVICGLGPIGYELALEALAEALKKA